METNNATTADLIIGSSGATVNGCITYPYYQTYPQVTVCDAPAKLGDFDLHLDRCGNLRVFQNGKMVGEFKPGKK